MSIKLPKEKYYRDVLIYHRIQNAARQNDFIEMHKINIEYSTIKVKDITYFRKLNYDDALFDTILLSIRRTDLKFILVILLIYTLGLILLNEFAMSSYISGVLFFICSINVHQLVSKHIKNIEFKDKRGIYLNYSDSKKLREYFKIQLIFIALIYFGAYLICDISLVKAIILMIVFCLVDISLRRFQTDEKFRRIVVNFAALASTYILFR